MFRVELIAFSFVDLISKQARLAAAVSAFLSLIIAVFVANEQQGTLSLKGFNKSHLLGDYRQVMRR